MIIAANWKMIPALDFACSLADEYSAKRFQSLTRILFAPHPYLIPISARLDGSDILLGGQDCHQNEIGAHTGDVSAKMLRDCGASIVLLGHSERRTNHGEESSLIGTKAQQALAQGLKVIICLGETLDERRAGQAEQVVIDQLRLSVPKDMPEHRLIIAYEPVWAIGTGEVASLNDIATMHATIASELPQIQGRREFPRVPILYGGSVNAKNSASIFSIDNVDGGLIGGASLDAMEFDSICSSACA